MMMMMMQVAVLIRDQALSTALPLFNSHSHFREGGKKKTTSVRQILLISSFTDEKTEAQNGPLAQGPLSPTTPSRGACL